MTLSWVYLLVLNAVIMSEVFAVKLIKTVPPTPDRTVAVGYSGLIVKAVTTLSQPMDISRVCQWNCEGEQLCFDHEFAPGIVSCISDIPQTDDLASIRSCVMSWSYNNSRYVYGSMLLQGKLTKDVRITLTCKEPNNQINQLKIYLKVGSK